MSLSCSSFAATVKILADGGVVVGVVITCRGVVVVVALVVVVVLLVVDLAMKAGMIGGWARVRVSSCLPGNLTPISCGNVSPVLLGFTPGRGS